MPQGHAAIRGPAHNQVSRAACPTGAAPRQCDRSQAQDWACVPFQVAQVLPSAEAARCSCHIFPSHNPHDA